MPRTIFRSGPIFVTVRYLWQKHPEGPYYYRRRVPKELAAGVGKTFIVQSLRTRDKVLAARRIAQLVRRDDEQWHRMRNGLVPETDREHAVALLESFQLEAVPFAEQEGSSELARDVFIEHLERKVPGGEHPVNHLKDHELRALSILNGKEQFTLSDAERVYLKGRDGLEVRPDNRKLRNTVDASFDLVIDIIGDRTLDKCRRKDVSEVIAVALTGKIKTATVKRRLGVVRAAVNELIREYELADVRNPFGDFKIPKLGEDSEERGSLDAEQIKALREYVEGTDTDTANIIGLLLDTGARIAEIAGLRRDDVVLDAAIPHIVIHENPFRRLKTKSSKRKVPLVGGALSAAKRAYAKTEGDFLFERYVADNRVKNDGASAAVNKVLKRLDSGTAHWLRHTMKTRLRNANVPEPRANEIQGWARQSVADQYGEQTALANLEQDLQRTL